MAVYSAHLCRSKTYPLRPRHRVTWIKTKREGVKNRCAGALKPGSDVGAGDLGVQTTPETSPWFPLGGTNSTHPGRMLP